MTTIKLFTDGGAYKKDNGKFTAVSSYRLYKDYDLINAEQEIHEDKTNNYAEIYSIDKGLNMIVDYLKVAKLKEFKVEVYSDSLLCVNSLTQWIYSWIKKAKDGILYNSVNQPVANQELIKDAFSIMLKLKGKIKIYHINSHEPISKIKAQYKKFCKFNKCVITYDDFMFAYLNNKGCDEAIKVAYDEYITNKNCVNK